MGYRPGKIYYGVELTPMLRSLLIKDIHLSLIDPPSLDLVPEEDHGTSKSKQNPSPSKRVGRSDHPSGGHGSTAQSEQRSSGTSEDSPEIERPEFLYGRGSGAN